MDKQQKIALILLPVLAIAIIAGGMSISKKGSQASASYTDGTYEGVGQGFGGDIKVEVVVEGGKIASVDILEHSESAGISDPAIDGIPKLIVSEQKIDVDDMSGATYSSKGIKEAVKNALVAAGGAQSFTDGEFEGVGKGFGGDIKVKVVVEGGQITSIDILEHGETPGISDPAIDGIPSAMIEEQSTDVDIVAGATGSSNGIMEAVKNALAGGSESDEDKNDVEESEPAQSVADMNLADGTYEGTGKGFGGDLKVKVEVKDGKLASLEVLDHKETPGISDPAINSLPGDMVDKQVIDVDNVSGATGTSKGIKEAVKNALESTPAAAEAEEVKEEAKEEPKQEEPKKEEPKKEEPASTGLKDGTFEGTGKGFAGDIKVKVVVSGGKITSVEPVSHGETPGISDPAFNTLPGAIVSAQSADVDNVSGATGSSKGIKEAVKNALK